MSTIDWNPFFLLEIRRCQNNYTLGNSADFSGLLLGCCWRCKYWHRTSSPPPPHSALNTAEHRLGHNVAPFVCLIFLANRQHGLKHWQGKDSSLRYSVFSFKLSFFLWTEQCCFPWPLEACCLALVPGRQNTAHALLSSLLRKKAAEASRSLHSVYTFILGTLALSFYVHWHKQPLKAFSPSQQLTLEHGSGFISLFSSLSPGLDSELSAWRSHDDIFMFMFTVHRGAYLHCVLRFLVIMCSCAVLTARKSMQYIPKEEWPE